MLKLLHGQLIQGIVLRNERQLWGLLPPRYWTNLDEGKEPAIRLSMKLCNQDQTVKNWQPPMGTSIYNAQSLIRWTSIVLRGVSDSILVLSVRKRFSGIHDCSEQLKQETRKNCVRKNLLGIRRMLQDPGLDRARQWCSPIRHRYCPHAEKPSWRYAMPEEAFEDSRSDNRQSHRHPQSWWQQNPLRCSHMRPAPSEK